MIVSDNPKFICFQPWKCGSTTLYKRLRRFDNRMYPQTRYKNPLLERLSDKHIPLSDFVKLPENEGDHIRFTFVRNPYDRLYSGFLQQKHRIERNPEPPRHPDEEEFRRRLAESGFTGFMEFCLNRYKRGRPYAVTRPLHHHVYHDDKPAVDLVGFLETFEASYAQICSIIGIENTSSDSANVRFKADSNAGEEERSKPSYRYLGEYSGSAIAAANEIHAADFERLGYRKLPAEDPVLDGQSGATAPSPFSDADMAERDGDILKLDRRNGELIPAT